MRYLLCAVVAVVGCSSPEPVTFEIQIGRDTPAFEVTVDRVIIPYGEHFSTIFSNYEEAREQVFMLESWSNGNPVGELVLIPGCDACVGPEDGDNRLIHEQLTVHLRTNGRLVWSGFDCLFEQSHCVD